MGEVVTDKGYAWVVLVAAFFAQAGSIGFSIGGIGVSLNAFGERYPNKHMGDLAVLSSLRISTQFLSSLIVVMLIEKLGFRVVALSGSILALTAIAATIATTELWHAYILFGVIAGFGLCCPYAATMTLLGQYFNRLKHIAFPVVALGQAVGTLSFPPIVQAVYDSYGFDGMLSFSAGSLIICIVASFFLKANDGHTLLQSFKCSRAKTADATECGRKASSEAARCLPEGAADDQSPTEEPIKLHETRELKAVESERLSANECRAKGKSNSRCGALTSLLNLLRRWQFCLLVVNSLLWGCCTSATQGLLPSLAKSHCLPGSVQALGVTLNGVGMLLASLIMMALGKCSYDRQLLYMLSCCLYGLPPMLLPHVGIIDESYVALFAVCGWWLATLLSLCNSVLFDMASNPAEFAKLVSLYFFANGIGCFIGPVSVGSVSDQLRAVSNVTVAALCNSSLTEDQLPANSSVSFHEIRSVKESNLFADKAAWAVCGLFGILSALVFIPTYISNRRKKASASCTEKENQAGDVKKVGADAAAP